MPTATTCNINIQSDEFLEDMDMRRYIHRQRAIYIIIIKGHRHVETEGDVHHRDVEETREEAAIVLAVQVCWVGCKKGDK